MRAGVHLVADLSAVLGEIVVVRGDGTRAEVHPAADRGVADVREVGHLAALADRRVLRLDEGADLAALGEDRAGPQVRERAHGRARADDGEGPVGTADGRSSPTSQSSSDVSGPMTAPEATAVARRMCVFGSTVTSGARVAVTSIQGRGGSWIVAPSSCPNTRLFQ